MRNGKKMRAARAFPYVLLFLGFVLAGREAPEIARLADDVSNDGMAASRVEEARPRVTSRKSIPLQRYFNRAKKVSSFRDLSAGSLSTLGPSSSGQHYLRLLCVQRK